MMTMNRCKMVSFANTYDKKCTMDGAENYCALSHATNLYTGKMFRFIL